jgi:aminoglycoside phosphotransferase (APT) family kinase protein
MPDQDKLDHHAILDSLGIHDALRVTPVSGGADTAIWKIETRGGVYALRVMRPEQGPVAPREAAAMRAATAAGVRTPRVEALTEWNGRPVMLLEWLWGTTLLAALLADPTALYRLGFQLGQLQAQIHAIPAPPELTPISSSWVTKLGDPALETALAALPQRKEALLHLDFHPLNVMVNGDQIAGVIDWTNAHAGDPRADFARTYTILRIDPSIPDTVDFRRMRHLLTRAWRHGYMQAAGTPGEIALFFAWAGLLMIRDLSPRVGKPGYGVEPKHLDSIRAWAARWKARAGL